MRALLPFALLCSTPALAYELRRDSQGDVVRWQREIVFVVSPDIEKALGAPGAMAAIRAAIAELDEATTARQVSLREGATTGPGFELQAPNQNEIIVLSDWPYTDGALASTVVTLNARTDEILDTDIVFNVEQHTFRVLQAPMAAGQDLDDVQNTLTHELGHALGLMHNAEDRRVVMYPRASAGETGKRALQDDDRQGLVALYGALLQTPEAGPQQGCSSTGSASPLWLLALAMGGLLARRPGRTLVRAPVRRRRLTSWGVLVGVIGASGVAQAQVPQEPIGVVVVRAKVAHRLPSRPGLIVTSLDVVLEACVGSSCERVNRLTVPGGRLGDLEQIVEHHPVPQLGERLGLARKNGRFVIYRLAERDETVRFDALLLKSASPQKADVAPGPLPQALVPAK